MTDYAIILASGTGSRAGGDLPKQFRMVAALPLLMWPLMSFSRVPGLRIVLVLHPDYVDYWRELSAKFPSCSVSNYTIVTGGATRIESVQKGLAAVAEDEDASPESLVCVHDGARPLVTPEMILRGLEAARQHKAVAVPVVPVTDSLRMLEGEDGYSRPVDRSRFMAVQTPQIAPFAWLHKAYQSILSDHAPLPPSHAKDAPLPPSLTKDAPLTSSLSSSFTDDASILQAAGYPVTLYEGSPSNIKVTTPSDFQTAASLISALHPHGPV